ncbi:MAG: zinc-dependent alcohol dehydrogenase [Planctomycetota bacterium]
MLTAPGRFEIREGPAPRPGPGDALVRIRAVGVCGSDLHMFREGSIGGITIADAGGPFVPGHECMGVVEAVGDGVDQSLPGRRVFVEPAVHCGRCRWCLDGKCNVCPHHAFLGLPPRAGCLSEYLVHPARLCEPLPDQVDDDTAVLLEPLAIATHSLDRLDPSAGAAVVVLGAGTIGLTHVMLLAGRGSRPLIVTDVLDYRLALAQMLGATHTLNPRRDDVVAAVTDLTGGYGADYVFECAGEAETFDQMVEAAAPAGRVAVVGIPAEDRLAFKHSAARRKGLDVLMIRRANRTFGRALARTLDEKLPLAELATHHDPLDRTQRAYETAAAYADGVVKAVINP